MSHFLAREFVEWAKFTAWDTCRYARTFVQFFAGGLQLENDRLRTQIAEINLQVGQQHQLINKKQEQLERLNDKFVGTFLHAQMIFTCSKMIFYMLNDFF